MGMRIYLAKTAHHQLIPNIYRKSEKGKPSKKDLPSLKNDITRILIDMIRVFYCSYQNVDNVKIS